MFQLLEILINQEESIHKTVGLIFSNEELLSASCLFLTNVFFNLV